MKYFSAVFIVLLLSCQTPAALRKLSPISPVLPIDPQKELTTIAFGSCNHQYEAQPMWQHILENKPELWIWMGDNIYGDTENMKVLAKKYQQQIHHEDYQPMLKACPMIGTWDDHDYGVNNGGKEYPKKKLSKLLFENFIGLDENSPVRKRDGIYNSYTFGEAPNQVKVILLDCRSFRDEPPAADASEAIIQQSDILGTAQWQWLEKELAESQSNLHLIVSGIQVLPEDHRFERWDEFPASRKKLFQLLEHNKTPNVIFLSGDRHIGEISQMTLDNGKQLTEITSSGLTHSYEKAGDEPNRHRKGKIVNLRNFGLLQIDWKATPPRLRAEIKGIENKSYETISVELSDR